MRWFDSEMELALNIQTKNKKEPICAIIGVPVSMSVKKKIDELKSKNLIDVNKTIREMLDQLIEKTV